MKTLTIVAILACALALMPLSSAYADDVWTGYTGIDRLDVQDTFCLVFFEGANWEECEGIYRLRASSANYKQKLTLLMGAFFGGFEVNIKYSETADCEPPIVKVRARQ
jgi:hypothetical protein